MYDDSELALDEEAVLSSLGLAKKYPKKAWEQYKAEIVGGVVSTMDPKCVADFDIAWKSLTDRLRAQNCLSYGGLILEALSIMQDPVLGPLVRKRYRHVIADEMQDSSPNQWRMIEAIQPETLFVVGDHRQAIYRWRMADPDLFVQYGETAEVVHLPYSYRFGVTIAEPANALMSHQEQTQLDHAIEAIANNDGSLEVVKNVEHEHVADMIIEEMKRGTAPGDMMVLARKNVTLRELSVVLTAAGVPHVRIGASQDVCKSAEFTVVKSYLRLMVNPLDRNAWLRISAVEGLGTADILEVRKAAVAGRCGLLEAWGKPIPKDVPSLWTYLTSKSKDADWAMAFALLAAIQAHEGFETLADLVQYIGMMGMQDRAADDTDLVRLMTIHASKGLESPVVFITGMNAKTFPSPRSVREGNLEEERCLFYVALTRAERTLYLVQPPAILPEDGPSQFLLEIGPTRVKEVDLFSGDDLSM